MKKSSQLLKEIALELQRESERMAISVRESGKQAMDSIEDILRANHRISSTLFSLPNKIMRITDDLEKKGL